MNTACMYVWRYHHYRSRMDYTIKRATMLATLRKVHMMASDADSFEASALSKCKEFINLGYPIGILRHMCGILAHSEGQVGWMRIRKQLSVENFPTSITSRGQAFALPVQKPVAT